MAWSPASTGSRHVPPPSPSVHLNIGTETEKEQFLKEIQPLFLEIVDPWESGLLDRMIAEGLLTRLDQESLSGKDVRTPTHLRRKVWFHLTGLTVEELRTKVFPTLYQEFPHIIPGKFLTQTPGSLPAGEDVHKACFPHRVMRTVRVDSVVDKMYQHHCISLQSYSHLFKNGCTVDQLWAMLFDMCASQAPKLTPMMKDVLEMHRMPVPANLGSIVSRGFPCTCVQGTGAFLPHTPPSSLRRVDSWIEKLPSWLSSRLPGSIRSTKSSDLYSISEKNPAWQSESVVNSNSMLFSTAAAAFLPQDGCPEKSATFDLDRGRGEIDVMSGLALPQISVSGFSNPPSTVSLNTLNPNCVEIQMADLTHPIPQRMEMMIQNEASSGNGRSYVENSANQSMRAEGGCPVTGVSMLGSSKIWKLLLFPGIPLMAFALVLGLALNGVQIFQLYKGSINPGDQVVSAVKMLFDQQGVQLIKNVTSVIADLRMKQHKGMDDA